MGTLTQPLFRFLLGIIGRAYQVCSPIPSSELAATHSQYGNLPDTNDRLSEEITCWDLAGVDLRPGWYMLEVEHSLSSIGCILTLDAGNGQHEHLLLTSKPVCKRILQLRSSLKQCRVSINEPDCRLAKLTIVGISQAFAHDRIQKRLKIRGLDNQLKHTSLYKVYRNLVHEAVEGVEYSPLPLIDYKPAFGRISRTDVEARDILVLHFCAPDSALDASVATAIAFAQDSGWHIVLQQRFLFRSYNQDRYSDRRIFHMPVISGAQFRIDAFVQMLNAVKEDTVLVYSDHDCFDLHGNRCSPSLKPEWNPDYLLCENYIKTPWMISDSWLKIVEGKKHISIEYPEILLLIAALGVRDASGSRLPALTDNQVTRVPEVLVSLHLLPDDVANDGLSTDFWQQQLRAVLSASGARVDVTDGLLPGLNRITWRLPPELPSVDIIIPTRDKVQVLKACIESVLQRSTYTNYRILIIDNDSKEQETERYYASLSLNTRISVFQFSGAFNFSAINNYAVSKSHADVLVLLNNDTEVISPGWLEELVSQAIRDEIGCVGAKLYYSNGRIQHGGVIVGIGDVAGHAFRYSPGNASGFCNRLLVSQNMTAVTAACLAVRRKTYLEAGGLDEHELCVAWNDVDFCMKVRDLGYRNLWTPYVELYHHEGLSRGADDTPEKVRRVDEERRVIVQRWSLKQFNDPAYHPFLTQTNEHFGLRGTEPFSGSATDE